METAYALKSTSTSFLSNGRGAADQLRYVDKTVNKVVDVEVRDLSIEEMMKNKQHWNSLMEHFKDMKEAQHKITLEITDNNGYLKIIEDFEANKV